MAIWIKFAKHQIPTQPTCMKCTSTKGLPTATSTQPFYIAYTAHVNFMLDSLLFCRVYPFDCLLFLCGDLDGCVGRSLSLGPQLLSPDCTLLTSLTRWDWLVNHSDKLLLVLAYQLYRCVCVCMRACVRVSIQSPMEDTYISEVSPL